MSRADVIHNKQTTPTDTLDVERIRKDFPVLQRSVNNHPLVYLDNAATSQKPQVVIDTLSEYYSTYNSNVHRAAHELANIATQAYEHVREQIAELINAPSKNSINFTRGTTEGINLVAYTWGTQNIGPEDEILLTEMEHHSNIVPWQMLCERTGATLNVIPVTDRGTLDLDAFDELLSEKTKLLAVLHTSNALGTVNPINDMVERAHAVGARVMVDGAQAVPHHKVDVQDLDCDFFAFSGHKMFGPTGIGVLYGKEELLEDMPPFHGGGEMIDEVSFEGTTYNDLPYKFEAGTPNIADTIALGAAREYIETIGYEAIERHEETLLAYATDQLQDIEGLQLIGTAKQKAGVLSFVMENIHANDLSILLDKQGIAVRDGHHCCQPLMKRFGIEGTCRASLAFYNRKDDIDRLVDGIVKAKKMLV